jgi:hypothetical protein
LLKSEHRKDRGDLAKTPFYSNFNSSVKLASMFSSPLAQQHTTNLQAGLQGNIVADYTEDNEV